MESTPTPQQPATLEEVKQGIGQLQTELQSMTQDDPSRGEKLKKLISLVEQEEVLEKGEIVIPSSAGAATTNLTDITNTDMNAPVDTIKPEPSFAQVQQDPDQK